MTIRSISSFRSNSRRPRPSIGAFDFLAGSQAGTACDGYSRRAQVQTLPSQAEFRGKKWLSRARHDPGAAPCDLVSTFRSATPGEPSKCRYAGTLVIPEDHGPPRTNPRPRRERRLRVKSGLALGWQPGLEIGQHISNLEAADPRTLGLERSYIDVGAK